MTSLSRVRVDWTGFVGGPGVSTFYCTDPAALLPDLRTFFEALKTTISDNVLIEYENAGDIIESTTGVLTGAWSTSVVSNTTCTNGEPYNAAGGLVVNWLTDVILAGRRLRGKTFVVPIGGGGAFDSNGQIDGGVRATVDAAAAALIASAGGLEIWKRPKGGTGGGHGAVTAGVTSSKAAVLRSRRD